jgi:hypothetical protein
MRKIFLLLLFISLLSVSVNSVAAEITITADTLIENPCRGGSEAAIGISVEGGTPPYTYLWEAPLGQTFDTEDIENLTEGSYSLTVTDQLDLTALWDTTIFDPNPNSTFIEFSRYGSEFQIKCNGDSSGWINVETAYGNGPDTLYTYDWEGPGLYTSDERDIDSLLAGEYFLTVTDTLGCTDTLTVNLVEPEVLSYSIAGLKNVQCYGPSEGYLKLAAEGGHGDYAYQWSGALISESDSIWELILGKYYYDITDSAGCSISDSLSLSESDLVEIMVDSIDLNPCLGQQKAAIYVSASGGEMPYQFAWTGPGGYSNTSEDIENLYEGVYYLDIDDARGCTYSLDTALVDKDPISVLYSVSHFDNYNTLCYGDSTGSIHVDTVAGNGLDWKNYTYIWTGPGGYKAYEYQINNIPAGNYHLNVFDDADCRSDITITLEEPPQLTIFYDSVVNNPCTEDNEGGIYISITGGDAPYTYQWTGPGEFTSSLQDIQSLSKGRYSVEVADSNACSASTDTALIQIDDITFTIETSAIGDYNILCNKGNDGFIKIKSVLGYPDVSTLMFNTTGPEGFTSNIRFMYELSAGLYHLSVTDSQGCSGEEDVTLTEPPRIQTGEISGSLSFIEDTNYVYTVLDSSSNSTFAWSISGGEIWTGQGSSSVEVEWRSTGSGRISVLETDINGCEGDTAYLETEFYTVTDPTSSNSGMNETSIHFFPNPVKSVLNIEGLEGGSLEIYSLTGSLLLKDKVSKQIDISHLETGIYYLIARNQAGLVTVTQRIIKH